MQEILSCIEMWRIKLETNPDFCDIALFKIFIKFELYISNIFLWYCSGQISTSGYCLERKLCFVDESHLTSFLLVVQNVQNTNRIDYMRISKNLSVHIFSDNKDPFALIYQDQNYKQILDQLVSIRNYIAHESQSAKNEYINKLFSGDKNKFVEPNVLLRKQSKSGDSYYTFFVKAIQEMCSILEDPKPYLK